MSKGHRDNHAARVKRGPQAFALKAERRSDDGKTACNLCGTQTRTQKLQAGLCPMCLSRGPK